MLRERNSIMGWEVSQELRVEMKREKEIISEM